MLLFLTRFLFGFALSLAGAALLATATWLSLKILALVMLMPISRRAQDAASAVTVLAVIAAALAALYGLGHALYGHLGAWPGLGQTSGWLAGPRPISPEALLGALAGFGSLAAAPGLWQGLVRLASPRPAEPKAKSRAAGKADNPAKAAKAAPARAAPSPGRATVPQLGWMALFLLAIGGILLAFAIIVAPIALKGSLAATLQGAGRLLPIYAGALALLGCGLLCLLLWRVWRRAPGATSR
ncbi:hypothetical protein [Bordetella sp. FB-8]|uniref:hypothetical protein n=1 Tax=Bordetella sp. FB-8 TaxID=1159870 RepID=UPI00035FFB4D|nr:hypothetical protein [Bordetella sp. FB-8]